METYIKACGKFLDMHGAQMHENDMKIFRAPLTAKMMEAYGKKFEQNFNYHKAAEPVMEAEFRKVAAHFEKLEKNVTFSDLPPNWTKNGPKGMIEDLDITISDKWQMDANKIMN